MDASVVDSEFLSPLVHGWLNKIEVSRNSADRKSWKAEADECMMFYSQSAAAMWNPKYSKKFWSGTMPRFKVAINKAFELVAITGPTLFWDVPHREVEPKRPLEIPEDVLQANPEVMQLIQQLQPQQAAEESRDEIISYLMSRWLNYTPREQPGGGLSQHSTRAIVDALIKGRGVLRPKNYTMPSSGRTLTGAFYEPPEHLFIDPDFDSLDDAKWIALKHVETHRDVEERFNLPRNTLKGKSTLESSWIYAESSTEAGSESHRAAGKTTDLVVWYEVFSRQGVGCSHTSMDPTIRDHLDKVVPGAAYICICADLPYPLNAPSDKFRKGASDEQISQVFDWPIPYWTDGRWPIEVLDLYLKPGSAYPVPPLTPAMGELKLLNMLVSWFANRTWSSSRDFWAVAQPYLDHYKEYIQSGEDQAIIPTPVGLKSPSEAIEILTQPEARQDMTRLIEFVSQMFNQRTGMTPTMYGQNEGGTQSRTAEETQNKYRAAMTRVQHQQKQVVEWQGRVAASEAFVARWFVGAKDVADYLGPVGGALWERDVVSTDVERVVRQFRYTIAAASIRRPNRERDIGNYQQVMSLFAPVLAQYAGSSGNYDPWNGMVLEWGRLHDADVEHLLIPSNEPSEEAQAKQEQFQEMLQQLELQEKQANIQKLTAEAQNKQVDAQTKPLELQADQAQAQMQLQTEQLRQQGEQARQQGEMIKSQMDMQFKEQEAQLKLVAKELEREAKQRENAAEALANQMELLMDMQKHDQEMEQDQEEHEQELDQKKEMGKLEAELKRKQAKEPKDEPSDD